MKTNAFGRTNLRPDESLLAFGKANCGDPAYPEPNGTISLRVTNNG